MSDNKKRAAVQAYVDAWRAGDRAAWLALWADDAELIDPVGAPANVGSEAIAAVWDRVTGLGMTMVPVVERIAVCGDEAVLVFTMNSLMPGFGGMASEIVDVFEFDADGRFQRMRAYWDNSCMKQVDADTAAELLKA